MVLAMSVDAFAVSPTVSIGIAMYRPTARSCANRSVRRMRKCIALSALAHRIDNYLEALSKPTNQ
jgi:hypothetical protein